MLKKYDGWIPDYLAGYLDESQIVEFEKVLLANSALQTNLEIVEVAIEKYAFATSTSTESLNLKDVIWDRLSSEPEFDYESDSVVNLTNNSREFAIGSFMSSYIGIAASVLLLLSMLGNIYLANESKYQKDNFLSTLEEKNLLQEKYNQVSSAGELSAQEVALLKNPNMKVCKLISENQGDNNSLLLAIDMTQDMQVMVMSPDLPTKPSDHSYQLWAISSTGEMVCMGTFDAEKKIYKMKKLPFQPKEFGVTMEEGEFGKQQPTSEFLVRGI
ncbi:MAG: hypothetical protein ACI9V1_001647 [Spirosomataceae bacterium]|jgi:hypothetical protein